MEKSRENRNRNRWIARSEYRKRIWSAPKRGHKKVLIYLNKGKKLNENEIDARMNIIDYAEKNYLVLCPRFMTLPIE
ncbi:MAG: hypothetical protein ACLFSE_12105 [Spirochaetia bacterium]